MMRSRWLVYVEVWSIWNGYQKLYGLEPTPLRQWCYYRWRWMARFRALSSGLLPLGYPAVCSARVLGRVTERGRSWRYGYCTIIREI